MTKLRDRTSYWEDVRPMPQASAWGVMAPKTIAPLMVSLALLALLAAACGDGDDGAGAANAPAPAFNAASAVQAQGGAGLQGITVSGLGSVTVKPDTALLSLGVSALAGTAGEARDRAAEAMTALLDSLQANGIADDDINTTQFSLNPEYDYSGGSQPRLTGYRVTNTVSLKVRDLDRAPEVIDEAVDAVGDPIQIGGITFTVDDPQAFLSKARAQAMADAQAKAQQLAELGGVDLGPPIVISEASGGGPQPLFFDEAKLHAAAEFTTPIQAGQLEITVSVQVTYAIQ